MATMSPEVLYHGMGQLIATMPTAGDMAGTPEGLQWAGRAFALVSQIDPMDGEFLRNAANGLPYAGGSAQAIKIITIVYRAFAVAEAKAPIGAQGSFIPTGATFDGFAAMAKLLGGATKDLLIVDPYFDESFLVTFGQLVPEGVRLRLLADEASVKPSLAPGAEKWIHQYGDSRPLEIRLTAARSLHDRAIFIDHATVHVVTQSFKDLAARSPATLVVADPSTAGLKIRAYGDLWDASRPIA